MPHYAWAAFPSASRSRDALVMTAFEALRQGLLLLLDAAEKPLWGEPHANAAT